MSDDEMSCDPIEMMNGIAAIGCATAAPFWEQTRPADGMTQNGLEIFCVRVKQEFRHKVTEEWNIIEPNRLVGVLNARHDVA